MTKVRTILEDAALDAGVRGAGEPLEAVAAADYLRVLNRMMDDWSTDDLLVYTVNRQMFPFVPGKQSYTLGTGGDLNTPRPVQIEMVSVLVNGVELPIRILNDEEWRAQTVKAVNSTFPTEMWPTGNFPLNELWFWPIPQGSNTLVLYTWGILDQFADINADVVLPKGYEQAIVSNLALRIYPMHGKAPDPVVAEMARKSLARLRAINYEPTFRSVDPVLGGEGQAALTWKRSRGYVID